MTAIGCDRCGSVDKLARARQLQPDATRCDACYLDPRAVSPRLARRCADCGGRPSRGHPLGLYETGAVWISVCFACYAIRYERLSSDQILDGAAGLEITGDLEHADAVALVRWAHREPELTRTRWVSEAHRRIRMRGLGDWLEAFPDARLEGELVPVEPLEEVVQVVESCLLAWAYRWPGEFCSWRPIRNGLATVGLDDPELIDRACERLGVERRRFGSGERWRLSHAHAATGRTVRWCCHPPAGEAVRP